MLPISDPILVFTVLVLIMLVAPLLAERLRVPDLVLLLIAGAILGPNGFEILERNTAVTMFGSVGILYIMFLAGLEIDLHRFSKIKHRSILFGLLTFAIPQVIGMFIGKELLGFNWPTSILLASMFASHTLLAYPLASRLGISRSEPVAVTVGATIITDTLALLVLAVIAETARGTALGWGFGMGIGIGMIALVLVIFWGIPKLTRWFFENVTETGGTQFMFVLAVVCGCAYLSHFAKMEPIIGAFLVGAAFNRLIPEHSVLMNRVVFVGNNLFIPFFLISVGMLINPRTLVQSPRSWLVVITMVVVVIATKYAAAWVAGKLCGYDTNARKVMFGLSVVQAAATLAAVLVGYDLKIFDETVLNGAIAMIMVTCPLGSWMVDRYGRAMAVQGLPREKVSVSSQHLLVPVANPAFATQLLDLSFCLRDTSIPGTIHPLAIVQDDVNTDEAVLKSEKLIAQCLSHAAAADISIHPSVRVDINVSDGIVRAAKELRSSLTLIGWGHEHSVRSRIFGTVMEHLLEHCPSRLLFCRLVRPINTTKRLVLVLSPMFERRSDLTQLLHDAKFLSQQIGAGMHIYLVGKDLSSLKKTITSVRPSRPIVFMECDSPSEARHQLSTKITDDDMILLPSERRASVLWSPTIDKLPEWTERQFSKNNLLIAYPSWVANEAPALPIEEMHQPADFTLKSVDLEAGCSLDAALRRMTEVALTDYPQLIEKACQILLASAKSYPVELKTGTVLLHGHCEHLDRPLLIVSCGSWDESELRTQASVLLALLNPKEESSDRHLKSLATLARCFRNPQFAEQITQTTSAQEICRLIASHQSEMGSANEF